MQEGKVVEEESPDFINLFDGYNFNKFMLKIIRDKQYDDIYEHAILFKKFFTKIDEKLFISDINIENDFEPL